MIFLHGPAIVLLLHFSSHESLHFGHFYIDLPRQARKLLSQTRAWSLRPENPKGVCGYLQFKDCTVVSAEIAAAEAATAAAAAANLGGVNSLVSQQIAQAIGADDRDPRAHGL
jgi:hypothetical protein